ncbi:MAG: thioredoxin family protein, partial [Pirellulaceae bacterium]
GTSMQPIARPARWLNPHRHTEIVVGFVFLLAFLLTMFSTRSLSADDDAWSTDAEAAAEQAAEEKRDMLLLFTGTDWCPPCMELEKKILSQGGFLDKVAENFVLVKFDFPQNTPQEAALMQQNQEWSDRFGISAFPTVVLVDSQQRPYAFTGFREEGPDAYITHLEELRQARVTRDEFLAKADKAEGLERARMLDSALSALDTNIVEVYYSELVDEIGELDKEDMAGLRTKYFAARDREIRKAVMSNISMVARLRKPAEAIEFIDATLAEHKLPADMLVIAQLTKLRLLRQLDRIDEANALVDQLIQLEDIDSDTRQRLVVNKAFYLVSCDETDMAIKELDRYIGMLPENLLLTIAKGELYDSLGQFEEAIAAYDKSMTAAAAFPDMLVEVAGARADALFELKRVEDALAALDAIIDNEGIPGEYRAEALLHKALILRETGRRRAAILSENKAVEIVETVEGKAEIQKLVDQFRRKFDTSASDGD